MTLREWVSVWLTTYKLGTIKERSYHQLELLARKFPDNLMDMELAEIRPLHLQGFINQFSQDASKSYMDKMRVLLHGLFSDALDNDLVNRNPSAKLPTFPRLSKSPGRASQRTRRRRL